MNQLYKIGIVVAIMLLVLLGLSKLNSDKTIDPVEETPEQEEATTSTNTISTSTNEQNMSETQGNTMVVLKTNKGDVTVELFTEKMPITAGNFLKLAKENFYDGVKFHRIIDGFMIQGGDPNSKDDSKQAVWGTGGPGYAIEDEFVPGFSNVRGTLAMANSGPNSGGSQFFINLVDNTNLDYDKQPLTSQHPVFGRVVEGMDVVDAIAKVETGPRDVPVDPVVINDIIVQE
jgi:peptidylprolyl isomerase